MGVSYYKNHKIPFHPHKTDKITSDNIQCWQRCGKINSVMLLLQWPFHWGKLSYNCWIQKCLLYVCVSAQLYIAIWDPMDWGLPSSSVHGVLQARILEWVAITYSRGSSRPRDQIHVSCISCTGRWIIYHWATWEAHISSTNHVSAKRYIENMFIAVLIAMTKNEKQGKCLSSGKCLNK